MLLFRLSSGAQIGERRFLFGNEAQAVGKPCMARKRMLTVAFSGLDSAVWLADTGGIGPEECYCLVRIVNENDRGFLTIEAAAYGLCDRLECKWVVFRRNGFNSVSINLQGAVLILRCDQALEVAVFGNGKYRGDTLGHRRIFAKNTINFRL